MNDQSSGPSLFEDQLHRALRDPVTTDVLARSIDIGGWFRMDSAVANLVHEETFDAAGAGVRGDGVVTTLTFEHERISIEVEVARDQGKMVGQLLPAMRATIRLLSPADTLASAASDAHGMFEMAVVPSGPFSLSIRRRDDGHEIVRTAWSAI